MGYKLAELASKGRHVVTLVSGPTRLKIPNVKRFISISTTDDLLQALKEQIKAADCLIMCAAVSDFSAGHIFRKKIKRAKRLSLELIPNKDVLAELSRYKKGKLFIGFSLETENLLNNSYKKLKAKDLDLIVANLLTKHHNVFGDNKLDVCIINRSGSSTYIRQKNKAFIAHVLLDKIEKLWYLNKRHTIKITNDYTD